MCEESTRAAGPQAVRQPNKGRSADGQGKLGQKGAAAIGRSELRPLAAGPQAVRRDPAGREAAALSIGCPGLQRSGGAHCQLSGEDSRQSLHAFSAGRPGLQHIEGALCQLSNSLGLPATGAMCAGRPGLQHIREAQHQLIELDPNGPECGGGDCRLPDVGW